MSKLQNRLIDDESKKIVIDTREVIVLSEATSNMNEKTPSHSEGSVMLVENEDGKIWTQGRWTQYEHLIFLA